MKTYYFKFKIKIKLFLKKLSSSFFVFFQPNGSTRRLAIKTICEKQFKNKKIDLIQINIYYLSLELK